MGSCLGHCRLSADTFGFYKFYSKANDNVDIQFNNLANDSSEGQVVSDLASFNETTLDRIQNKRSFVRLKSVYENVKKRFFVGSQSKVALLDDEWLVLESDVEYLKRESKVASASINSLDLEWEHLPEMAVYSGRNLERDEPKSVTSADGGWSRISSAESLEWDLAEVEDVAMKEDIDTETEQLLQEIEMLTSKTLEQTQEWANS